MVRYPPVARAADPVLYPTAVLLGGLGLAMLYRLMVARGHPEFASEQAVWLAIGLASFVLTIVVIRDVRQLDAYTYTIGLAALILLLLPIVPGVGTEINGAKLWVNLGFVAFQPAEAGRILIVIFLGVLLVAAPRDAGRRRRAPRVATAQGPRAPDPRVGCVAHRPVPGARHGRVAAVVRRVRGDDVGRDRPVVLPVLGLVLFAIGAYIGYLAFSHVQVRVDAWLHAMDPKVVADQGSQLAQGWFALATGGWSTPVSVRARPP